MSNLEFIRGMEFKVSIRFHDDTKIPEAVLLRDCETFKVDTKEVHLRYVVIVFNNRMTGFCRI